MLILRMVSRFKNTRSRTHHLALAPIRKFSSSAFGPNHSRIFQMDLFPENLLDNGQMAEVAKMSLFYINCLWKLRLKTVLASLPL